MLILTPPFDILAPEGAPITLQGWSLGYHGLGLPVLREGGSLQAVLAAPNAQIEHLEQVLRLERRSVTHEGKTMTLLGNFTQSPEPATQDWPAALIWRAALPDLLAEPSPPSPHRRASLLARAASRNRATPAPATLRRNASQTDLETLSRGLGYRGFFSVEDYRLRHRRFDGTMSAPLERACFISTDAVVVLPYDPQRDRVLLIEQFRTGPMARGDANPWLLEAIAGRIDAGQSPEDAAKREAIEEAGLTLQTLLKAPSFYPSPAAKSEYIYCFIGLCDLAELPQGGGGLACEGEDIRSHLLSFAELMALVESGEINNSPLLILALSLAAKRPSLRG